MRDYQRTTNNPYHLPKHLYKQTLSMIRDYNRLKEEYEDALEESQAADGQPKGNKPGDPTFAVVVRVEKMHERITAIEKAKKDIPEEYLKGIWQSIIYGTRYPTDAGRNTYGRWKARFIWQVAKNMGWI